MFMVHHTTVTAERIWINIMGNNNVEYNENKHSLWPEIACLVYGYFLYPVSIQEQSRGRKLTINFRKIQYSVGWLPIHNKYIKNFRGSQRPKPFSFILYFEVGIRTS